MNAYYLTHSTAADLLAASRARRIAFQTAALAAAHITWRFTMPKPPRQKETVLSRSLMSHIQDSLAHGEASDVETPVTFALKLHLSPEDKALCMQIAERGVAMAQSVGVFDVDLQLAAMDISVVHVTSCPLHLWQFLASAPEDFSHDFTGIGRFIERKTGFLREGFKPRFAKAKS